MSDRTTRRLRSAAFWSYGQTTGRMAISTALSLLLAAMLGPTAYGIVAMALVFTNFIEVVQQQGMMPAIISKECLSAEDADTAFWLVLVISVAGTVLGIVIAPGWATVNGTPELADIIRVLALTIPLTASAVVHEAMLRRDLAFKKLAIRTWAAVAGGGVAGVAGAVLGWGVWALVAQQVTMSVVAAVTLWLACPWRPHFRFIGSAARDLWSYSVRATGSSLGSFVGNRVDVLLAGLFFGADVVGLYRLGQRVTSMVVDVTARAMQSVALPGLAEVQRQPLVVTRRLLSMQRTTSLMAIPGLGVVFGVAPDIQRALGPEWVGTTPVIRILVLGQMLVSMVVLIGPALQAVRRPGILGLVLWGWSAVAVIAIVGAGLWADDQGILALCWAIVLGNLAAALLHVSAAVRVIGVPLRSMVRAWVPGLLVGFVATATTTVMTAKFELGSPMADLLGSASTGVLLAGLAVLAIDPTSRHALIHRIGM